MNKAFILSLMLALVLGFVSVNAAPCNDVNFTYSLQPVSVGQSFYLKIKALNPLSPEDPWGEYISANLSLPTQMSTTDSLAKNLTSTPYLDIHDWAVTVLESGSFTASVTLVNSIGSCELSKSISVQSSTSSQGLNFVANQPQTVSSQSAGVNITMTTTEDVSNQEVTITKFSSVANGSLSGKKSAGRYIEVVVLPELGIKVSNFSIKVSYLQSEVDSNNINEATLKLYKYNTATGIWDALTSVLDATNNFVEVSRLSTFPVFGLFGDENAAPASGGGSSGGSSGGGGGGGGVVITPKKCTEADYTCTDYSTCSSSGSQTRSCSKKGSCTGDATPKTSQSCTYVAPKPACTPNWECTAFSTCASGSQARTCVDKNNCATSSGKPAESQTCVILVSEVINTSVGGFTGLFVGQPILQYKASAGASTTFKLDDVNHTITVKEVKNDSAILVVQSDPVEFELKIGQSKSLNIDDDKENDIAVKINSIENGIVFLTIEKPEGVSPGSAATGVVLLVIVVVLGFMVYKKHQNRDRLKITIKRQDKKFTTETNIQ